MKHINLSLASILEEMENDRLFSNYYSSVEDKLNYAIDNQCYIRIYYDDKKGDKGRNPAYGNPRDIRKVIPYCLGYRNGRLALRAFHANNMHTKKGPFKWKFFYVDNMKGVFVYKKNHFQIPALANPNGDKHMEEIVNMVGMPKKQKFVSPHERELNNIERIKRGLPDEKLQSYNQQENPQGPVRADLQKKRNVNTMANLNFTPKQGQLHPSVVKKNIAQTNNPELTKQKLGTDYDAARKEADRQSMQNRTVNQVKNTTGPVTAKPSKEELEGYDEYMNQQNKNNTI